MQISDQYIVSDRQMSIKEGTAGVDLPIYTGR